jgi:PAS domain-containing protein
MEGAIDQDSTTLTEDGRYRLLIEAVRDYAIYMLDPEGIVSSWNPGAERFKGYSASEIMGQHFSRFYTEDDREAGLPARALETARREGKFENEGWRVRMGPDFGPTSSSARSAWLPADSLASPRSPAI